MLALGSASRRGASPANSIETLIDHIAVVVAFYG